MGWASNSFPLLIIVPTGGFTGLFVYSPAPGPGNLIDSITAQSGTDPYGNAFLQGITNYTGGAGPVFAAQLANGELQFVQAATEAGPYTLQGQISQSSDQNTLSVGGAHTTEFWVFPSGDTSGVTDATLINGLGHAFGAIGQAVTIRLFPTQGTPYYVEAGAISIPYPEIYIRGPGRGGCFVNVVGSVAGDGIRMYSTLGYMSGWGGSLTGFTLDGSAAPAGSTGFHVGDIYQFEFDVGVRKFTGAGDIGGWLDNQYTFMEGARGLIWAEQCSTGVQFDNSTGTTVSASATGSFDRACLEIYLDMKGDGNCVVFANGAFIGDGDLSIRGNTDYGGALYYVLTLTGSNAGGFSRIFNSILNIGVECNATVGTQPGTINFATSGSNTILGCTGIIDFSLASPFASAVGFGASFQYDGPAYGDTKLQSSGPLGLYRNTDTAGSGNLVNGDEIFTRYEMLIKVFTNVNVTAITLQGFTPDNWRLICVTNKGSGTITFDIVANSHVANGTNCVIQPNAGMLFQWDNDDALWYQIQ